MAITYPLSLPTNVSFSQARMIARSVVGVSRSPFTGEEQVQKHQGQWFEFDGKLPPMTRANAEEGISFLLKLNGRQYTFLLGDPSAKTARGIATGTPLINGASQTGNSLITDGWTASQTGILRPEIISRSGQEEVPGYIKFYRMLIRTVAETQLLIFGLPLIRHTQMMPH